jgi:hypothetical protein
VVDLPREGDVPVEDVKHFRSLFRQREGYLLLLGPGGPDADVIPSVAGVDNHPAHKLGPKPGGKREKKEQGKERKQLSHAYILHRNRAFCKAGTLWMRNELTAR